MTRPTGTDVERLIPLLGRAIEETRKLESELEDLMERVKIELKRGMRANQKLCAILRALVPELRGSLRAPYDLRANRFSIHSQNEEDGMLLRLLRACGQESRTFVEIGSGSSGGNSGMLATDLGWRGLMVDMSPRNVLKARSFFGRSGAVVVVEARVTPENINSIIEANGFSGDVDLLSLDIDSFDYWVFRSLTACRGRILILEYNPAFGATRKLTIPLGENVEPDSRIGYHGASLSALTDLARSKGYRLVGCDFTGVNAFFVRQDLAPEVPGLEPAEAFRSRRSRWGETLLAESEEDILTRIAMRGLPLAEL